MTIENLRDLFTKHWGASWVGDEEWEAFLRDIEAREKEIRREEGAQTWRPIETAPDDGTSILALVRGAERPVVAWYEKFPRELNYAPRLQWRFLDAEEFESDEAWEENWRESRYEPDFWLPIPDLPMEGT